MKKKQIIAEQCINFITKPTPSQLTSRDSILYNLGIGFSKDPLNQKDLEFTYELNENFKSFPTVATCFHQMDIFGCLRSCPGLPKFHAMNILHGEQRLNIIKPIYPGMKIITKGKIANVEDKGKNALINLQFLSYEIKESNKQEELCFINTMVLVIRGLGGFNKGNEQKIEGDVLQQIQKSPSRNPDKIIQEQTEINQAILYRLNGDPNPLHIDPNMSSMANFEKPILHGLCTYGIAAKVVMQQYCDNNPYKINNINCRFVSHVFPGEKLEFSLWKENSIVFISAKTVEREKEVIYGTVELKDLPKPKL